MKNVEKRKHKKVSYGQLVQVRVSLHQALLVAHQPVANRRNQNKVSIMVDIVWAFGFASPTRIYCENKNQQSQKYDLLIVHVTPVKDEAQLNRKRISRNGIKL